MSKSRRHPLGWYIAVLTVLTVVTVFTGLLLFLLVTKAEVGGMLRYHSPFLSTGCEISYHIILSYHTIISYYHIILSYHTSISYYHIILSYHTIISYYHIILSYHHSRTSDSVPLGQNPSS